MNTEVLTRPTTTLPEECYIVVPTLRVENSLARAVRDAVGFKPVPLPSPCETYEEVSAMVHKLNAEKGVSPLQAHCMRLGAMWGWATPGTDPSYYTDKETNSMRF